MLMRETLEQLSQLIKEKYGLETINEDMIFDTKEVENLSFLKDLNLSNETLKRCQSDYCFLFPYIKDKKITFSLSSRLGRNIFLIDRLPQSHFDTLSPYHIQQYEDKITEEANQIRLDSKHLPLLFDFFHQRIEKMQLLDFLQNESVLKSSDFKFYEVLLLTGNEEENRLFSDFIYITKKIFKDYVRNLGAIAEDDYKLLSPIRMEWTDER